MESRDLGQGRVITRKERKVVNGTKKTTKLPEIHHLCDHVVAKHNVSITGFPGVPRGCPKEVSQQCHTPMVS